MAGVAAELYMVLTTWYVVAWLSKVVEVQATSSKQSNWQAGIRSSVSCMQHDYRRRPQDQHITWVHGRAHDPCLSNLHAEIILRQVDLFAS